MRSVAAPVALIFALAAAGARAQSAAVDPAEKAPPPPVTAPPPSAPLDPFASKSEAEALAFLRALEAKLSLGQAATPGEVDTVAKAVRGSPHPAVRALAAAVLAWLDPASSVAPLIAAFKDTEPRVRAVSAESLLSLARRFDDEQRRSVVSAALGALDDQSDEAACAAAELLGALSPSAAADAVRTRGETADDVRYSCYARIGGLPNRPVTVPPMPSLEKPPEASKKPPPKVHPKPAAPADGSWLYVGTAASAGLVAGGVLPSAFLPSRDVLLYTDDRTRLTHEEVAFPSQAGAALLGAAALGGGAYALTTFVRPLDIDEAGAVAIATGALGLAGASAQLTFALREGPAALATSGGLVLGLAAGSGLAYGGLKLGVNDEILGASFLGIGALTSGLAVFAAVPVGYTHVGDALRVDFGLGIIGVGAGVASFAAIATGTVVDVSPGRSFALVAGATLGGGTVLAAAFLVTPTSDVKSRIACGAGLAGEVAGLTAALFIPDEWLAPIGRVRPVVGTAVSLTDGKVSFGIPVVVAVDRGLGATLVSGTF